MFLRHDGEALGVVKPSLCLYNTIPQIMEMRPKSFEGGFVEHLLELGMRHRDDEFGPFLQRASVEIHRTIFRDEPVDVVARGDCT